MLYLCNLISSFHSTLVDGVEMQKKYGNVKKLLFSLQHMEAAFDLPSPTLEGMDRC